MIEIVFNDTILLSDFELEQHKGSNLDGFESKSSMIWFGSPNYLSLYSTSPGIEHWQLKMNCLDWSNIGKETIVYSVILLCQLDLLSTMYYVQYTMIIYNDNLIW